MWILIFTLIVIMAWIVRIRERTNNYDHVFNALLMLTTFLLIYALGQEIFFN